MSNKVYKPEDMLLIEMAAHAVLNDALGRYIHDPRNLDLIRAVLGDAWHDLELIEPEHKGCPPGYVHKDCSCVYGVTDPPPGPSPSES